MAETPDHLFPLRVYFEDTDAGGMVYHASYLRFAERARTEWLCSLGLPHRQLIEAAGLIIVVKRLAIEYHRPARLEESLVVATRPRHVGAASVTLLQAIRRGEEAIATLEVTLACVAVATGRPMRLPALLRARLSPHP